MNLTTASRTFQLLSRIFDVRSSTVPFIPSAGEKVRLPLREAQVPLPRATPESEGISADHIRRFLQEMGRGGDLFTQNVMILRHGKVLCAAAYGGQDLRACKYTFSACKSLVSLAVGLLVDDGLLSLDERVADLFPDLVTPAIRRRIQDLSVEDLLTMRAGLLFSEAEALTENDWVRRFLNAAIKGEPGSDFRYNSLNTYMLSVIVKKKAGRGVLELLQERIFTPLGISDVLWETCPMGTEKGGWGLYIRPEDMAKVGQLVLDRGMWQGKQLISPLYIDAATATQAVTPASMGDFNYGYQIWVGRKENTFLFNGMLGQNVLGFKDSGILLVTNAGQDTGYQESRYFELASRFFGGQFPDRLPEDEAAQARLADTVRSLSAFSRPQEALDSRAEPFLDMAFRTEDDKAPAVGLLPVVLQALHNNYTTGVTQVAVSAKGDLPELIYREKEALYRLTVGLGRPVIQELSFQGDCYQVSVLGRFTQDEDGRPVFVVRMEFLETPCIRTLKLVATEGGLLLRQTETPGAPYIFNALRSAAGQPLYRPLLLMAAGGTDPDFLWFKTQQIISPEIKFTRI